MKEMLGCSPQNYVGRFFDENPLGISLEVDSEADDDLSFDSQPASLLRKPPSTQELLMNLLQIPLNGIASI